MPSRRFWRGLAYSVWWRLRPLGEPGQRKIVAPLALAAVVVAVSYAVPTSAVPPAAPAINAQGVVTRSTDQPAEAVLTDATYRSSATGQEPYALEIPVLNVQGFIQKVGVDQHSQIAVPTNIHLAGWFVDGAIPGEPGLSIIDGHLDGSKRPGIFSSLGSVKVGDEVNITLASREQRIFRVRSVQTVPTAKAASVLFSQTPGIKRQLNLITCGGTFSKSARSYDERVVVITEYDPSTSK